MIFHEIPGSITATMSQGICHGARSFASVGLSVALAVAGRPPSKRCGGHRAAAMARRAVRRAYGEWESPITATGWHEKLQVLWDYGDVMKDFGVWGRVFDYDFFGIIERISPGIMGKSITIQMLGYSQVEPVQDGPRCPNFWVHQDTP